MLLVPAVMRPALVVRPVPVDHLAPVAVDIRALVVAPAALVGHLVPVVVVRRGRVVVPRVLGGVRLAPVEDLRVLVGDLRVPEGGLAPVGDHGLVVAGVVREVGLADPRGGLSGTRRGRSRRKKRTRRNRRFSLRAR